MILKGRRATPSTGYAKGAQEGEALPKRGLVPELVGSQSNTLGGGPPRIVYASRIPPRPLGDLRRGCDAPSCVLTQNP